MNEVFRSALDSFVTVYLDDILIFSRSEEEHIRHLRWVFTQLREHKLFAKRSKCSFGLSEVEYLGHIVGRDGVRVDPAKIAAVRDWPEPTTIRALQQFMGLANYYNRFVRSFARLSVPLSDLLQKGVTWAWGDA